MKLSQIRSKLVGMVFWFGAAVTVAFGQVTSQTPELKLNEPLERQLSSGQTHEYQVALKVGEFMQVRVEQKGIDVALSIHSTAGTKLAEMDSPNGMEGWKRSRLSQTAREAILLKSFDWKRRKTHSQASTISL